MLIAKSQNLENNCAKSIIRYWGRKPYQLASHYIKKYSKKGDVILDCFGGSGVFIKAALQLGRRGVYIDLNPFAYTVALTSVISYDRCEVLKEVNSILTKLKVKYKKRKKGKVYSVNPHELFKVRCKCGRYNEISYAVVTHSYDLTGRKITDEGLTKLGKRILNCIKNGKSTYEQIIRRFSNYSRSRISREINLLVKKGLLREHEKILQLRFLRQCKCGRTFIKPSKVEWKIKDPIFAADWYPKNRLCYNNKKTFLKKRNADFIFEFFPNRTLAFLASLWKKINRRKVTTNTRYILTLAFFATLIRSSKMARKSGGTWPVNSYWIPRVYLMRNPILTFENVIKEILRSPSSNNIKVGSLQEVLKKQKDAAFLLTDAMELQLPPNSIDYVITDPPHTDDVQFFELSFFYTTWLRNELNFEKEVVINPKQGKGLDFYTSAISKISKNIHNALKEGRHYTLILHGNNEDELYMIKSAVAKEGFRLVEEEHFDRYVVLTFKKI